MPSLVKLYNEFKNDNFIVLAINIREDKETTEEYVKEQKLPFPVLLDVDGKVAKNYGVRATPIHFIIDREGKMIGAAMGAKDWVSVESQNLIRSLLGQDKK